jgi:hypothetical protein
MPKNLRIRNTDKYSTVLNIELLGNGIGPNCTSFFRNVIICSLIASRIRIHKSFERFMNRHLFGKAAVDEYCVRHAGGHLFQVVQGRAVQLLHTLQHTNQI